MNDVTRWRYHGKKKKKKRNRHGTREAERNEKRKRNSGDYLFYTVTAIHGCIFRETTDQTVWKTSRNYIGQNNGSYSTIVLHPIYMMRPILSILSTSIPSYFKINSMPCNFGKYPNSSRRNNTTVMGRVLLYFTIPRKKKCILVGERKITERKKSYTKGTIRSFFSQLFFSLFIFNHARNAIIELKWETTSLK